MYRVVKRLHRRHHRGRRQGVGLPGVVCLRHYLAHRGQRSGARLGCDVRSEEQDGHCDGRGCGIRHADFSVRDSLLCAGWVGHGQAPGPQFPRLRDPESGHHSAHGYFRDFQRPKQLAQGVGADAGVRHSCRELLLSRRAAAERSLELVQDPHQLTGGASPRLSGERLVGSFSGPIKMDATCRQPMMSALHRRTGWAVLPPFRPTKGVPLQLYGTQVA
mmetsp:Transcript_32979/g.52848  ORF Transcript_32979/g.52848 Transcript_32979/m.52848 type:complete len:218 (-) Transcript_32979:138-791(-)